MQCQNLAMEFVKNSTRRYALNHTEFIQETELFHESDELVKCINVFTDSLPENEISDLALRLKFCVNDMPMAIEQSFHGKRKIDKIRSRIKLSVALEECRECLDLISKFKYANTSDLLSKLNSFRNLLTASDS